MSLGNRLRPDWRAYAVAALAGVLAFGTSTGTQALWRQDDSAPEVTVSLAHGVVDVESDEVVWTADAAKQRVRHEWDASEDEFVDADAVYEYPVAASEALLDQLRDDVGRLPQDPAPTSLEYTQVSLLTITGETSEGVGLDYSWDVTTPTTVGGNVWTASSRTMFPVVLPADCDGTVPSGQEDKLSGSATLLDKAGENQTAEAYLCFVQRYQPLLYLSDAVADNGDSTYTDSSWWGAFHEPAAMASNPVLRVSAALR
jgi:hypothetical protein